MTDAFGGVALAEPTTPLRPNWIPALRDLPAAMVRTHLQRLPEAAPVVAEEPLLETDLAPGFTEIGQACVGRGLITDLAVSPRGGYVFATNHADDSVSRIDPETMTVVGTVSGLEEPFVITAAGSRAYVSTVSASHDAVTVVDTKSGAVVATHPLALSVRDLVLSADGRRVYVARTGRDGADVAVIDTVANRVTTIDLGTRGDSTAEAIAISRDGRRVYVATTDPFGGELVAIDTRDYRVISGSAFTSTIRDIAVSPDGRNLYVAGYDAATGAHVDIVDSRTLGVTGTVAVGGAVTRLVLSTEGERLYLVNGDRVTVVGTATREIIDTITVGGEPACVAESRDGKRVFVADYDGSVTAFSVASTTESLLAKMMAPEALELPALRELEPAGV
ncbi:YncE family protein [Mycolicibacterium komossense]|uniref:YncE family protein n=1 Tax=Mycolicibacterium komossense TaxID=1779 RepID=A0ABT3C559_9MYCO|nr:YncE family protein [Mycolicibacterium komossense]MCV7224601.1 YncE family protein [Mycolicibacterium komossense]